MASKLITVILNMTLLLLSVESLTPYEDCGSDGIKIIDVNLNDCTGTPCQIKRGNNATMQLAFTAKNDFQKLYNQVFGVIQNTDLPFYVPSESMCGGQIKCPIVSGSNINDTFSAPVHSFYPQIKVRAMVKIVDDKDYQQGCLNINIELI
jgi:hypothetical protein